MSFHGYRFKKKVTLILFVICIISGLYIYFDFAAEPRINKGISPFKNWMQNMSELVKSDVNIVNRATTIPTITAWSAIFKKGMPVISKEEKSDNEAVLKVTTNIPSLTESAIGTETKKDRKITNQKSNISGDPPEYSKKGFPLITDVENSTTLFQSIEEEEFPSTDSKEPRIPHIIHQMYANEMIPEKYVKLVKSFIKYNPTWEYRFWTDQSGRELLQKHHPYLVNVYDAFGNNVKRSDLLRYAVLYEYGGFYADFDMENFRSLNKTTLKYACIFPVEPFEHSAILYNKHYLINNAFMGCRPKHPFLKLLLSGLHGANIYGDPVKTTGPWYVTEMFNRYNNISSESVGMNKTDWSSNSPYFYKGQRKEIDDNAVYVPNSQYFMDKFDPIYIYTNRKFIKVCRDDNIVLHLHQRACSELSSRKTIRANRRYTYTVHHWYHLWLDKKEVVQSLKKVNISSVVPDYIQYHDP